ncbi:unnamed protein product [Microthlaspi erraticum]|uniref:F-box domain-containing protein n=1 Tax=Microthlaspi erraticum TaxID=1685480 RepID=A0A6D2K8Y5_9BRAS|nr:unnamed protein product [Microthlaspi erraticum]
MASCSKRSSSSHMPIELVEEILCRVPLGSLARFISICKEWYTLFNDKRSIYKHLDLSQKRFIHVDERRKVQHLNPETQAISCLQGPSGNFTMIHCDGLLLCQRYSDKRNLAVWNPFLRRVKWIEPSNSCKRFDVYGFGHDNVSRENYKILGFDTEGRSLEIIEIYEFKSKLWRSVDASLNSCAKLWYTLSNRGLSMNGNMYWIARRKEDDSKTIASFDFSRETFKEISCGVPFDDAVTDAVVSWSKFLDLTSSHDFPMLCSSHCIFPAYFIDHKTNNIMVRCGKLDVMKTYFDFTVYEMCDRELKEHVLTGRSRWSYTKAPMRCYEYVPSLVPVPE